MVSWLLLDSTNVRDVASNFERSTPALGRKLLMAANIPMASVSLLLTVSLNSLKTAPGHATTTLKMGHLGSGP
jgi:hypothetical protein